MVMNPIFSIPEIVIVIGRHLKQYDLCNCVLVNSSWNVNFTPYLWRIIESTMSPPFKFDSAHSVVQKQAVIDNSHFIRALHSNSKPFVALVLAHCTQIRHISFTDHSSSFPTLQFIQETFIPAMERNQTLKTLVCSHVQNWSSHEDETLGLLKQILRPLRSLTHLDLNFGRTINRETFLFLFGFAKQLHQFKIKGFISDIHGGMENYRDMDTAGLERTHLRWLELRTSVYMREHIFLIPFLESSPDLETLVFPSYCSNRTDLVAQTLRQHCPKLQDINLERSNYLNDQHVAEILKTCLPSGLRSFQSSTRLGSNSIAAFCAYSTTLESVKISAAGRGSIQVALHLLTSCPNLRTLIALTEGFKAGYLGVFSAKELLKDPWICLKVEVLSIPIVQIYRTAVKGAVRNNGDVRLSEQYDHHQSFYTQLSKLTRLQELNVGFSLDNVITCQTSPLFSLESGLAVLEVLKNLRVLDVSFTRVGIRRKELEWMCDHWPQLEKVEKRGVMSISQWWVAYGEDDDAPLPEKMLSVLQKKKDPPARWVYT